MPQRAFLETSQCVFVAGAGLAREQALVAAARLHVKPAALTAAQPFCALVTSDRAEAQRFLDDARTVNVDAWAISGADVRAADQASRVTPGDGVADFTTANRVRRVVFARVAAYVDVRWKPPGAEARVVVVVPDDAKPILVKTDALEVDGPSRQGAVLKLLADLQHAAVAAAPQRVLVVVSAPHLLGTPPEVPADVVALGLAEHLRRRAPR